MITMENIVRDGHPALRETAEPVELPPTDAEKQQLADMIEFVKNSQNPELAEKYKLRPGVGLAAPQINIKKRMIAVHAEDASGKLYSYALFNPKIVSHSVEKSYLTSGEGCLSVDEAIPGYVPRYARIRVKGTTLEGETLSRASRATSNQSWLSHLKNQPAGKLSKTTRCKQMRILTASSTA